MLISIRELYESGQLELLVRMGIVQAHVYVWVQICVQYEAEVSNHGSRMQAMENVATDFQISTHMVRAIRKKLSTPPPPDTLPFNFAKTN